MNSDRTESRYTVGLSGGMKLHYGMPEKQEFRAVTIDVSCRGMLVRASHKVQNGDTVILWVGTSPIELQVLWCRSEQYTFKVGLRTNNPNFDLVEYLQKHGFNLTRETDESSLPIPANALNGCTVPKTNLSQIEFI